MDEHEHRYFIFKTFEGYAPATDYLYSAEDKDHRTLYDKHDFAILGCNCGDVIKMKVKTKE